MAKKGYLIIGTTYEEDADGEEEFFLFDGKQAFALVRGMFPSSLVTNAVLYHASSHSKEGKTIKIVKTPLGPGIPEKIRKGWLGVVLKRADGPFVTAAKPMFSKTGLEFTEGYAVNAISALESLKKVSAKSWEWFLGKDIPGAFFFNKECCKIIS